MEREQQRATAGGAWSTLHPPLRDDIVSVLTNAFNFPTMTPVQAATIPLLCTNKDVCVEVVACHRGCCWDSCSVQAVTGSGKTLAYIVPLFQKLLSRDGPLPQGECGAIVIGPTRELAQQVGEELTASLGPVTCAWCQVHREVTRFTEHLTEISSQLLVGGTEVARGVWFLSQCAA